jgi:hypothetical protein
MMATPDREGIRTWSDLIEAVSEGRGLYVTTIEVLRDIEGAGRTGDRLMETIRARLQEFGIGYLPEELPTRRGGKIVLYRKGTRFAEIVRALQSDISGAGADNIVDIGRRINTLTDARRVVPIERERLAEAANAAARVLEALGQTQTEE